MEEKSSFVEKMEGYTLLATIDLSTTDVTLPFVIKVAAPHETVVGISGPCMPNISNWKIEDGYLVITYTKLIEIIDLKTPGTYYVEVATNSLKQYAIQINVY